MNKKRLPPEGLGDMFSGGGGGYSLIRGYWGCAAGWGRVFRAELTIMGLHF